MRSSHEDRHLPPEGLSGAVEQRAGLHGDVAGEGGQGEQGAGGGEDTSAEGHAVVPDANGRVDGHGAIR